MKRTATTVTWTVAAMLLAATVSGCSSSSKSSSSPSASATGGATTSSTGGGYTGGSSASPSTSAAAQATVSTKTDGKLGTILVNGQGRTLYLFQADTSTTSTCSGACSVAWPPLLTSGTAKAAQGAKSNLLGTTKRSGGGTQVTYNGHPLYYYSGDAAAGDTNGQGLTQFGALWYVLDPAGHQVTTS